MYINILNLDTRIDSRFRLYWSTNQLYLREDTESPWVSYIERAVDCLPLMIYGLKLSVEAWISKFKNFKLSFKEII